MKLSILGIFLCSLAMGQPADAPPKFDAADIRVAAKTQFPFATVPPVHNGRYTIKNATMVDLINRAYKMDADKILGGPHWLEMDRFDITAKVPAEAGAEAVPLMLQALLADRFQLVVHTEDKPLPAYALVAGKKPALKAATGTEEPGCKVESSDGGGPGGIRLMIAGGVADTQGPPQTITLGRDMTIAYNCRNMTMASFVTNLPRMMGSGLNNRPVSDETGLKGNWNFDVRWSVGINIALPGQDQPEKITAADAIEKQLGLKLEERQVQTPVIVVDKVNEKPTPDPPGTATILPTVPLPTKFEVASVKPADAGGRGGRQQIQPGGRVTVTQAMRGLLFWAFNVNNSDAIAGVPDWANSERFDIIAKAPSDKPDAPALDRDAVAPMMLDLLTDRFKLTYHTEDRAVAAYTLTAGKPKLKKADPASRTFCHQAAAPPPAPPATQLFTCQNITMAEFADQLTGRTPELNWPVLDATGIEGGWDFSISFSPFANMPMGGRIGGDGASGAAAAAEPSGRISILDAIEKQLGLKLEKQKRTEKIFVIDHLEQKPTEN